MIVVLAGSYRSLYYSSSILCDVNSSLYFMFIVCVSILTLLTLEPCQGLSTATWSKYIYL